jgi:uncharacterized membrane protein
MNQRTDALINGALIAIGALGVADNVVVHWALRLHRAVPGRHASAVEATLVILSAGLLALGVWREQRARRGRED